MRKSENIHQLIRLRCLYRHNTITRVFIGIVRLDKTRLILIVKTYTLLYILQVTNLETRPFRPHKKGTGTSNITHHSYYTHYHTPLLDSARLLQLT